MTIKEIQALVKRGESNTLEFKRKVTHPEKIVREIVAFANTQGGDLLIGVDDNGEIPGLKYAEEEAYALENAVKKYCRPPLLMQKDIVPISSKKSVIRYVIEASKKKPHVVKEALKSIAYVRFKDRSVQASKEVREILRRQRRQKDIRFTFGEKEKLLMEYLEQYGSITLDDFAKLAGIRKYYASKALILLVLAKVLKVEPQDGKDIYKLNSVGF